MREIIGQETVDWFSPQNEPENDRLVLVKVPSVGDPEENELPCKNVWMGHWDRVERLWWILVPGASSWAVKPTEVSRWCEIPN